MVKNDVFIMRGRLIHVLMLFHLLSAIRSPLDASLRDGRKIGRKQTISLRLAKSVFSQHKTMDYWCLLLALFRHRWPSFGLLIPKAVVRNSVFSMKVMKLQRGSDVVMSDSMNTING
ncbi:hypothetical protein IL59_0210805 [Brucella suis bv. 4 str. 40]|nr:hypothetical protein IL59_0210805 [Brucella suis bv. 4 str. 40]